MPQTCTPAISKDDFYRARDKWKHCIITFKFSNVRTSCIVTVPDLIWPVLLSLETWKVVVFVLLVTNASSLLLRATQKDPWIP